MRKRIEPAGEREQQRKPAQPRARGAGAPEQLAGVGRAAAPVEVWAWRRALQVARIPAGEAVTRLAFDRGPAPGFVAIRDKALALHR